MLNSFKARRRSHFSSAVFCEPTQVLMATSDGACDEEEMMEEMEESEEEMEESEEEESLEEPEAGADNADRPLVEVRTPGSQRRQVCLYVQSQAHDDFMLDALAADTIDSVKVSLGNILGIPPYQLRLKNEAGVLMENGKTLAGYAIHSHGLEHIDVTRDRRVPRAG